MKNLAVDKCWEGPKTGDEYRSLRIQLDHFVDHINKEDSPLSWLPLENMTEDELSDIAVQFYRRNKSNRLIFSGLAHKGIKYDYLDLLIDISDREKKFRETASIIPELKDYQALKISELLNEINIDLVSAQYEGYQKTANKMLKYDDRIYEAIIEEKDLFKCIGLGYTNTQYIEQYISVCERICFGTMYYFIIANPKITDCKMAMKIVANNVTDMKRVISKELEKEKEEYSRKAEFHKEYYGLPMNNAENIMMYYVQFLNRQACYEEWEEIFKLLSTGIEEPVNHECLAYKNDQENIDNYILGGREIHDFQRKKNECLRIIKLARKRDNYWASEDDMQVVKILLREGFIDKIKYRRRTAMTIIRNILAGQEPDRMDLMFLDAKMLRGAFREHGYLEYYNEFVDICTLLRRIFLMPYSTIDDRAAYKLVHRICFDFLYIFGDTEYSKLKFE